METKYNRLTCGQAKTLDLTAFLDALGYQPACIRGADHWYLSPLRNEHTLLLKSTAG